MTASSAYDETIEYLYGLQKHGIKLELSNTLRLMEFLDGPHRKFRSVHVAGTNGKGSTSAFLASMLTAAGLRVGLYTSPHLVDFTERIRVNGVPIPEARVIDLARQVRDLARSDPGGMQPTFFEVTTAIAFAYFAEQQVDLAVVEVGMGGRLDATNVITPLVSVITNIDREHTEYLGASLEQIAAEKAGIIKNHVPVVTAARQPEVLAVIERTAAANSAALFRLGRDFSVRETAGGGIQRFDYGGPARELKGLCISLLGSYQLENAACALTAVELLGRAGIPVSDEAVRAGLANARWAGRLERVAERPDIFLDGAHNPASARRLADALAGLRQSYRKLILVLGILGDKDYDGMIAELAPCADQIVVTRAQYGRALDVEALAAAVRKQHPAVASAPTVGEALALARDAAGPGDLIIVTGSLYVVGDARPSFVRGGGADSGFPGLRG